MSDNHESPQTWGPPFPPSAGQAGGPDEGAETGAGEAAAAEEATEAAFPPEPRLSRKAAWLAMSAVTLALLLIWLAPGIDHTDEYATTSHTAGSPGEPEDVAAAGKPARLDFKLK